MTKIIGSLIKDENAISVQIGSSFLTSDASDSPKNSPLTLSGSVQAIAVPADAVEFIIYPITNDVKVSELSALTTYDSVAKSTKESFPCARMSNIYIQGTTSDVVYFRFTVV